MNNRKELKKLAKEQIKGNILCFFGVTIVIGLIIGLLSFTVIGAVALLGPLSLGISMFVLEIVRTKKSNFGTAFKGFNQFGSSLLASILMGIFTFLWSMLFVIPGIIAKFRYSMTYYILADNPNMSGMEAISKSKEMMKGHKGELFVIFLSFFWWYVLGAITFGLAYIYISPYICATVANFYEKIKTEQIAITE